MKRILFSIVAVTMLLTTTASWAQRRQPRTPRTPASDPTHKFEIIPFGGYVWTVSQSATYNFNSGDFDIESSGFWGIAIDINVRPGAQAHLLYQRQDSDITFRSFGGLKETLGSVAVEYWHVGGVGGLQQDNIMPFTSFSLGGTRYVFDAPGVGDVWKFSLMLGLGAKIYANERIGLVVQGRMPFTFMSGGLGVGIGTGGASVAVGGTGITQFDVSAGLMITL